MSSATPPQPSGVRAQDCDNERVSREHASTLCVRDAMLATPKTVPAEATAVLDARDERRLVVLDPDGDRLRGLLCLTSDRSGFCRS